MFGAQIKYYVNNLLLVNKYIILEHIKLKKLIFKKKTYNDKYKYK